MSVSRTRELLDSLRKTYEDYRKAREAVYVAQKALNDALATRNDLESRILGLGDNVLLQALWSLEDVPELDVSTVSRYTETL